MGQLTVPEIFRDGGMSDVFQQARGEFAKERLSEGISQGYGVIKYRGGKWSLQYRGRRRSFVTKEGFPSPYLDVVILDRAKPNSKSYFPNWKEDSEDRPACHSMNGVVPDPDVANKQNPVCGTCPRNIKKLNPQTGRFGRECSDYKRVAVVILPEMTAPLFNGQPLNEPVFLRVPADSLVNLATMGDTMDHMGFDYWSYVTRITFDPGKSHPCMIFTPHAKILGAEASAILELKRNTLVERILGQKSSVQSYSDAATMNQEEVRALGFTTGTTAVPPAIQSSQGLPSEKSMLSSTEEKETTGFGGANDANISAQMFQFPKTDGGGPGYQESNAELDAKLLKMLGNPKTNGS